MRKIAIVQCIHLDSHRIERKVMQKIGDKTVLDHSLDVMESACRLSGCALVVAVPSTDKELHDLFDLRHIKRISVAAAHAKADDYETILKGIPEQLSGLYDWIIWGNLACRPFLRVSTLLKIIVRAASVERPFVPVISERGIIWSNPGNMLLGHGQLADTKTNPQYYRLAHLAYAHPASVWDEITLAALSEPWPIELAPEERIDIDTPEDLEFARVVHRGLYPLEPTVPPACRPDGIHEPRQHAHPPGWVGMVNP